WKQRWVFVVMLSFMFAGCAATRAEWKKAQSADTVESYKEFLTKHPESEFAAEARIQIERKEWEEAAQKGTIPSYRNFLKRYPASDFAGEARAMLDSLVKIQTVSLPERKAVEQIFASPSPARFVVKDLAVEKTEREQIDSFTVGGPPVGTTLVLFEEDKETKGYSIKSNIPIFRTGSREYRHRELHFSNVPRGAVTRFLGRIEFGPCSLEACTFVGNTDNPLSFVWVPELGFVYLGGNGAVELKSGEKITLPAGTGRR
ncbi:MAG: tetratricopeptide repeat protein, partial [Syntrophobacteria bacterium]